MRLIALLLSCCLLAANVHVAKSVSLPEAVTVSGIMAHLTRFEEIAFKGGLNSRSVRNNYNASAEYVIDQLRPYCTPVTQHFVVPVHQELERPQLEMTHPYKTPFQYGVDFQGMRYGGSGQHNVTAYVTEVVRGCSASDFAGFPKGHIALIKEGSECELVVRAMLAEDFGAAAIFFYNQQTRTSLLTTRVRYVDWKEGDRLVQKPVLSLSNMAGKVLAETAGIVELYANMLLTTDHTYNVICDSPTGSPNDIVVLGAHLDSVPEGPGLNDNGSGSATLLEIALQFFKTQVPNQNKVRFGWWGAEEIGLLGARHYVREIQKNPTEFSKLALYMNFDMLGSPNFIPYIHDGYQVGSTIPEEVKAASHQVQVLFEQYFKVESLPYKLNDMLGGSDFLPFIEAGVPTSGMATGASAIKSADEREEFSGLANAAFDPCYHQPCDTLENISQEAIRQCSQATATVLEALSTMANLREYLGTAV